MSESGAGVASTEEAAQPTLSSRDRSILDFERGWTRGAGAKEDAVQSEFGLSTARYYQVLNALLDSPAALAYDPMLVKRLQRMREAHTNDRTLLRNPTEDPSRHS